MFGQGYGIGGGGWLGALKTAVFGQPQPRPRQVDPVYTSPPRSMNPNGTLGSQTGYDPTPRPVVQPQQQVQEDPLDRFERIARLMELGERVGGAFDKQPYEVISRGGGVASPQLPQSSGYGLSLGGRR